MSTGEFFDCFFVFVERPSGLFFFVRNLQFYLVVSILRTIFGYTLKERAMKSIIKIESTHDEISLVMDYKAVCEFVDTIRQENSSLWGKHPTAELVLPLPGEASFYEAPEDPEFDFYSGSLFGLSQEAEQALTGLNDLYNMKHTDVVIFQNRFRIRATEGFSGEVFWTQSIGVKG